MNSQPVRRFRRGLFIHMLIVLLALPAAAQEIDLSGFIKSEYIYDTRQVVQVREGQFHLFPLARADDDGDGLDRLVFQYLGCILECSSDAIVVDDIRISTQQES